MPRDQFNVRLPEHTINQIEQLVELLKAGSKSTVVILAIDRLYQETVSPAVPGKEDREMSDITNQVVDYYSGKVVSISSNASPLEIQRAVEQTFGMNEAERTQGQWLDDLSVAMGWRKGLTIAPFEAIKKLWPDVPQITSKLFFGMGGKFMGGGELTDQEKELVGL